MRFTDDYYSYDLVAKYKYTENLSLRFEGKNLDNRPEFYYWNSPDRLSQYDEYGYWMSFGFRYNF
jgi:outer membrane receptor for ferric coprogen and ferric-rhodotorulic acid